MEPAGRSGELIVVDTTAPVDVGKLELEVRTRLAAGAWAPFPAAS